jgi:predicted extracellular nuclease
MKIRTATLLLGLGVVQLPAHADLFFSEYVEGSSNNKALEITNKTGVTVDLSSYEIQVFFNGNTSAGSTIALSGSLDDGRVFVVADDGADAAVLNVADQTTTSSLFNGDDAIVLLNGGVVIDSIGQVGFDPGSEWGSGDISTQNNTLRRIDTISEGDTDQFNVFDPAEQWLGFAQDSFDGLGNGDGSTDPTDPTDPPAAGVDNLYFSEYIEGSSNNKALEIYNASGAIVDLAEFSVEIYFNGSSAAGKTIALSGSLADGAVYVVADSSAVGAILNQADQTVGGGLFNGDDAIVLRQNGEIVDVIGQVGSDPGSQWGSGDISTQNNTIRRLHSVTQGDRDGGDAFDPAQEWSGFANDSFDDLGVYASAPPQPVLTLIHDIQGAGSSTPLNGQTVSVEAIVVGDFQNNDAADSGALKGFYIQEEDADADDNPLTSEGIFVYDNAGSVDVAVGDRVIVNGTAGEYYNMTQISAQSVTVVSSGEALPTVTNIDLPVSAADDFEAYEGMLTSFAQSLVISEYYNFGRYGEIVLALPLDGEERQMTPTAVEEPGSAQQQARSAANLLARITLDDGRTEQNPDPALHPNGLVFDLSNRFRGGDVVQGAYGILDYRYSKYRLQPTAAANYVPANPRPQVPHVDGALKVASFNVLNYFTTLDENGNNCGPGLDLGCRGADNLEEFTRQRAKIIAAIADIDADIVGLIEIENNDTASIDDLIAGLNERMGAGTYQKIDTGFIGDDAIKVAYIYKPAVVLALGDFAILDQSVDARFIDSKNRPALAQTFMSLETAGRFTVAVNHLKSKGSDCNELDDPDNGDGQGNCNLTRSQAAGALVDWLATNPTGYGDGDKLIIGDLNAYDKEDPINAITTAGYTDLLARDLGEFAYTYVFDGQYGYLDHALANGSMQAQATQVGVWHINADEPNLLDYDTSYKKPAQDALYEANAYRSSDHDPVIVGLDLNATLSDILVFVEQADLIGAGNNAKRKLKVFTHWLVLAQKLSSHQRFQGATCSILGGLEKMSDGERWPRDLIEGSDAATVSSMIGNYRQNTCF